MTIVAYPCCLRLVGGRTAIAFRAGRKYVHAVVMGEPIHVEKLPRANDWQGVQLRGKPYPARRAARLYLRSEISKTGRATKVLRAIARGEKEIQK